jgi:PKHD-type hydroxylase
MIVHVPGVLNAELLSRVRRSLDTAPWVDGRVTAGHQGAAVKNNRQVDEHAPVARELGDLILGVLERNPLFISAALPARVYPPMFNRYEGGETFGNHIDNAVRLLPGTGIKLRTDISATLFISPPEDYDGGELQIEDTYGVQSVKLPAGDMALYPGTSLHRVTPVTRGVRLASFFWVQSMVREDSQRTLLFDLDMSLVRLRQDAPGHPTLDSLTACYHNLLRMWADT